MVSVSLPWEEAGWLEAVTAWIHARLAERGWRADGPLEVVHRRAWSAFARVPTSGGLVYFKGAAPSVRFEAALAEALARWRPDCMLPILAVDAERGWLLSPDAGVTLRSLSASPEYFTHWHALLPLYVGVQREFAPRLPELLALGTPDRRLAQLPRLYAELLADTDSLHVGKSPGLSADEHRGLLALQARVAQLCGQLAAYGLPETLTHEEVHDGNVLVGAGRYVFADWSDSSVAHPFFTLLVTLRSVAYRLGLAEDDPALTRLRDIYLDGWADYGTAEQLLAALGIAYRLAMVNRALSYWRILGPLPEAYRIQHDDTVGWLQDFLSAET